MFISVCPIKKYDAIFPANSLNDSLYVIKDWSKKQSQFKPNSKPIKANLKNDQNECKRINNNGLRRKSGFCQNKNKPKTKPKQTQFFSPRTCPASARSAMTSAGGQPWPGQPRLNVEWAGTDYLVPRPTKGAGI